MSSAATLNMHNREPEPPPQLRVPDDIEHSVDPAIDRLRTYAKSLPYSVEPNSKMQRLLDFYLMRIVQCIKAKDYDPGFMQWDSMLTYWTMLKYPVPKEKRIALVKLYFEICVTPGMPAHVMAVAADGLNMLTRSKRKLSIDDLRLPWKPIYDLISKELFLNRRKFEINQLPAYMGYIADSCRRFFHPAATEAMLETFLPLINGANLDSVLASQYYLVTFLPLSHPQSYLPMLFKLWESINSYMYDERLLYFLAQLAEMHVDPSVSNPERIRELQDDSRSEGEDRPHWKNEDLEQNQQWAGITKDVGIFSEDEWNFIMCKCLASMEIPLADTGSLTTGPSVDNQAGFEVGRLRKSTWRIFSLARIIVYSMAPDGPSPPQSGTATPLSNGRATPRGPQRLGDFIASPLQVNGTSATVTYLAGSKALDSLSRLIISTESFFHPNNSGTWTADLSAFIKYIVYEFNKRWHEEKEPDCKTPTHRRLTSEMKRELVKCLRTVALLAMFSRDPTTVGNIQSCLKSMTVMEPDLILHSVLERAIPSLEALVETQRTTAVIKALGAVALAIVSRKIYYPGAKHLVPILQLLIPGIDLNDPSKTLCTTAFLIEISQFIKFGDLTVSEGHFSDDTMTASPQPGTSDTPSEHLPSVLIDYLPEGIEPGQERQLTEAEEDALLKESTTGFADWISNFIRRVIVLLENLPEESTDGSRAGGETEVQVVDAVAAACSQICIHLSEPLYDLVLKMVFDYASSNVRSNAVRAVHQLVECVANANASKTLAKFMPFCVRNIRAEVENGASSVRTTSTSMPLPSDATLHWNLAILRGAMYNDGTALLKYKTELMTLFRLLRDKTFSKRGFSWSGKLLSSALLTLTHTYPLENKFVNPDEWNSKEFRASHHKHWGKLYRAEDVKMSWHVPNVEELQFALDIFRDMIEPTIVMLEDLLKDGVSRDAIWRNDICRYLTFVRNAFAGTPTLLKEHITPEQLRESCDTSDIMHELPEMIASVEPINSGFALVDPADPRYQYLHSLRQRFGRFLQSASTVLRTLGDENTLDAVHVLIRSVRTYMLEYGDSRDSYFNQSDQYSTEIGLARQYADQKVWPRAIFVRRARRHHAARLRWNSVERLRDELENSLIDEVMEWSMWHYATVRESSQNLLESLCGSFDGIRRRCLPALCTALQPGTDNDRMKGALYTLNNAAFAKYAISEPTLTPDFVQCLFGCQQHEKPSIQDCVATLSENCLGSLSEPTLLVYSIEHISTSRVLSHLENLLPVDLRDDELVHQCTAQRIERVRILDQSLALTISNVTNIARSPNTHWRYSIVAIRILRTLIRRDEPLQASQISYFLDKTHDSHPSMRYYAQRAVMKSMRYIKLRTFCKSPLDLVMEQNHNPLRRRVQIPNRTHEFTAQFLQSFKRPLDIRQTTKQPILQDKSDIGWLVWPEEIDMFLVPASEQSTFQPWESASSEGIVAVREIVTDPGYWQGIAIHFSEENHAEVTTQDNISCVKSIFQLLEDEPFESLRPVLEGLIAHVDQNKQRAAAELLAGVLGASKHWPMTLQSRLWDWFTPLIGKVLGTTVKTDTLMIWSSFLEYMFYCRDPRRVQPLVDYLLETFKSTDYNGESSFDAAKTCSFFRAFYEELSWRFYPWVDDMLSRYWMEISSEHDEVRAYIADALEFSGKIKWRPKPSLPIAEVFVRECRTLPGSYDIMGIRGTYHMPRVLELIEKFETWRDERIPGARAFQSTYDRVGVTICKWLFQSIHDIQATSAFDYILPLMPELFRFSELNDHDDLANRASTLLVRMCGVVPPKELIDPILDAIFLAIKSSPSWKVRLKALPLVQIFYFRQVPLIRQKKVVEILEVICKCLDDEIVEVREMAATTLSGILRLSPRQSVMTLKDRFVRLAHRTKLPSRQSPHYGQSLRKLHAAILGICAIVDSYPYTVERWMPELLTDVLAEHTYDPIPVSTTVRNCASNFKKTHQDTWHEDAQRFNEEQLSALSTLLTGSSYYA
ncbi:ARM repeat-containing protein [Rickenella mellea]|uniref:ARM repeat-containing protein n=1 Tax=Rickenella mellea TaxID=50990 RepID=A0A4Y7QNG1_9AGAM|nr:ARM repeat-containing protein [Rickenella mellea]